MEWISVKDKLPEDMYEIKKFILKKNEIVKVVLLYKPLIFDYDEKIFYISKLDQKMSVVTRLVTLMSDEYYWIDEHYNRIYDQQAIAWMPIPKYEEGGSDVSRNNQ